MNAPRTHRIVRARHLGVVATAALGVGLVASAAGPAGAASTVTATVANDTLFVRGTNRAEQVALLLAPGDPNTLQVDVGADGTADGSFDRSTFHSIAVDLRGG